MRITALKYQVRNPERVNVFVDGKYDFSLSVDQVLANKVKVGLELDQEVRDHLKEISTDGKLLMRALKWSMLRPRTEKEVSLYVRKLLPIDKRHKISAIIDDLRRLRAFDDERFIEWWLERRSSDKKSHVILRAELLSKGVSESIISEHMNEASDTVALQILLRKVKDKPRYQDSKKLIAYLMSKGFRYSSVIEALAEGTSEAD